MDTSRRLRFVGVLVALVLLTGVTPGVLAAQEEPDHPGREPGMVEIPDSDNPRVAAYDALRHGQGALRSAEKALEKADRAEGGKREKLLARSRESYEEAARYFLTAIQLDGELAAAYAGLGEAWLETGQAEKALQAWGAARQRAPEDAEALFGMGRCLVALDRPRDAASLYLSLAATDAKRAGELLELLRAWGEPRAAGGDPEAQGLLTWIAEQGPS